MFKVVFTSKKNALLPGIGTNGIRHTKSCRICGNEFLPLNASARTCEFCKTPFGAIVSGAVLVALNDTAAS